MWMLERVSNTKTKSTIGIVCLIWGGCLIWDINSEKKGLPWHKDFFSLCKPLHQSDLASEIFFFITINRQRKWIICSHLSFFQSRPGLVSAASFFSSGPTMTQKKEWKSQDKHVGNVPIAAQLKWLHTLLILLPYRVWKNRIMLLIAT